MVATARLVLSTALCTLAVPALAQEITINSFGGAYEEAHRKCVIDPYTAATGAKVNIVTAYSADAFTQLRAQKDAPQYDVMLLSGGQEIVGAAEGLLLPITEAMVPNLATVYDVAKAGVSKGEGPAYQITPVGLIYAKGAVDPAPVKWTDLLKPEFAEGLVLTNLSNSYGMIGFLMLNQISGGTLDNVQPGLDTVAKLLEGGAVVVNTSPELQAEFAQNGALIAPYSMDYAYTLQVAGVDVGFVQGEEGTPASFITTSLVAGRNNVELASKFIDVSLSPEAQACFAEAMSYTPTNSATVLSDEVAPKVVYGAEAVSGLMRFDPVAIEANRAAWVEAFGRVIAK